MLLSELIELAEALQEPRSPIYDFGLGVHPYQLQPWIATSPTQLNPRQCATIPFYASRLRQRQPKAAGVGDGSGVGPTSQVGKDGFQVSLDVTQFSPSELSVKVKDNDIIVEGKHEEREDEHGYITRHFIRRYTLPQGYEADKVMSSLSSDGVLTVNVPKPQALEDKSKERIIQIQQVGPAHLNVKPNEQKPEEPEKTN